MVKKFLALAVAAIFALLYPPPVSAEQAAAETYRQMFRDGNFYVEFQIELKQDFRIAYSENYTYMYTGINSQIPKTFQRVSKKFNPAKYKTFLGWGNSSSNKKTDFQILAGKNGARVYRENAKAKNPEVFYKDGKYYNYFNDPVEGTKKFKRRMLILSEEEINSAVLEPQEGWQDIRTELALPDELAIFYWNEPYREQDSGWGEPIYNGSSTREINKKTYDCDQYISDIKSLAGTVIAQEVYNALYENGKLIMVQKYFLRDGKERLIETVNIKTITSQVPDTAFAIDKKTKVYKPRNGDMNDLLNEYQEIGEIGGKSK